MATKNNDTIHELTRAEIGRQLGVLAEQRQQIGERRAELYGRFSRGGGSGPALSHDERAARTHAKKLLNGSAPPSLEPPPLSEFNFSTLDQQLAVEIRGIDIAVKILGDKELVARAAEAVQWAEDHAAEWRALVRETIMTAARLASVESAAARLLAKCVDVAAINLPMINLIGQKSQNVAWVGHVPITSDDLIEAGLQAGIVTNRDIEKAKNV
jgi:hypothetical protein